MMNLYRIRYRDRQVTDAFVKARDLKVAHEVAVVWCNTKGYKFISCRDPVVADESILGKVEMEFKDLSEEVSELPVKTIMDRVNNGLWSAKDVLLAERNGHDRTSLVAFCQRLLEAEEVQV